MKATVVEIQSKSYMKHGKERQICLRFDTSNGDEKLRLPESCLGIVGISLDDELDVSFSVRERSRP